MKLSTVVSLIGRNAEVFFRSIFKLSPRPYKLLLELTEHCNSRCQTCSIWKKDAHPVKHEFSLELARNLFTTYGKNLLWLSLSGGEITLYKDFEKLVQLIKIRCPQLKIITFTTNALNPEKTLLYARMLKSLGCDVFITISLDGDEETHDLIRGIPGNYRKAQQTYKLLTEDKIETHWGITLSDLNSKFVKTRAPLLQEIKAVTFAHGGGIYKQTNSIVKNELIESLKIMIAQYQIKSLGQMFEWIYIRLSKNFVLANDQSKLPCEVISTNLHIKANGDVLPCMFVPALGSLQASTLPELLKSPGIEKQIAQYRKKQCPGCWMNCYAPHSMMQNPFKSLFYAFAKSK